MKTAHWHWKLGSFCLQTCSDVQWQDSLGGLRGKALSAFKIFKRCLVGLHGSTPDAKPRRPDDATWRTHAAKQFPCLEPFPSFLCLSSLSMPFLTVLCENAARLLYWLDRSYTRNRSAFGTASNEITRFFEAVSDCLWLWATENIIEPLALLDKKVSLSSLSSLGWTLVLQVEPGQAGWRKFPGLRSVTL